MGGQNLTIRNLTITPLELKVVERFEGVGPDNGPGSGLARITSGITSLFNGTATPNTTSLANLSETQPTARHDVSLPIQPFSTASAGDDIKAPDSDRREVLRLTFAEPGTDQTYTVEIPGPSSRSVVMKPSAPSPSGREFTVIYLPQNGFLAIFSSAQLDSWMANLADSTPLSVLSIPGTHNSPTCYTALPSVRCQAVGVREQLDNGVRFLDIRVSCPQPTPAPSQSSSPSPTPPPTLPSSAPSPTTTTNNTSNNNTPLDKLALVHSAFPISLSGTKWFHDLLGEIYSFLDTHPTETLLMSVKREGTGKGTDQHLSRILNDHYFHETDGAGRRRWFTESRIPTLGESRGRIVLVRRFNLDDSLNGAPGGFGIDGSVWPDNCADGTCGSGQIRVQDFYEVARTNEIDKKIDLVRDELARAAQQSLVPREEKEGSGGHLPFFINFLSGSNFFNASCWPERIAAKINPAIIEHLCMQHGAPDKGDGQLTVGDAGTGIVVTDWVGHNGDWDLIRCIVGWNARLQLKQ